MGVIIKGKNKQAKMNPKMIDLSRFVQTGEGANGKSYDSLDDSTVMVKMYDPTYDTSAIIRELDIARNVFALGVPSPDPGQLVTDGKRIGIQFQKIAGKRSFARAFAQEPDRVPELTREFAGLCRQLHATQCPTDRFPSVKDDYIFLLEHETLMDGNLKERVRKYIRNGVPDCNTACHGDLHFGNVITTLAAGAPMNSPHNTYFIDLGYFGYGYPLFDIGMTYLICNLSTPDFVESNFHVTVDTLKSAWQHFRQEYFNCPDSLLAEKFFGRNVPSNDIDSRLHPFAMIKLLLVEYNCGCNLPECYVPFFLDTARNL